MDKQSVTEALGLLDSNNDDHWTSDGLPMLSVVSELVGEKVSRRDLSQLAPEFTRDTAGDPPEPEEPEEAEEPEEPEEADELAGVQAAISKVQGKMHTLKGQLQRLQQQESELINAKEISGEPNHVVQVRRRQEQLRREQERRRQAAEHNARLAAQFGAPAAAPSAIDAARKAVDPRRAVKEAKTK